MNKRQFLQGLIGLAVVTATPKLMSDGLELIASASAEEKKPKTVDDILAGTSFQNVCSSDYSQKTKEGNVVVFFYAHNDTNGPSIRLVEVYKEVEKEFNSKIKFLKYEDNCDSSLAYNQYQGLRDRFGVTAVPFTIFHQNGKVIDTLEGGPKEGFIDNWTQKMNDFLKKTYK